MSFISLKRDRPHNQISIGDSPSSQKIKKKKRKNTLPKRFQGLSGVQNVILDECSLNVHLTHTLLYMNMCRLRMSCSIYHRLQHLTHQITIK